MYAMDRFDWARLVGAIPRGQWIIIPFAELKGLFALPGWTPVESILENIIGSAYEFSFVEDHQNGTVTFKRRKEPLKGGRLRTYVSPDRRHLFSQRPDGLWEVFPAPTPTPE